MNNLNGQCSEELKINYFNSLPREMTNEIYGFLSYKDQKSFLRTSKSTYQQIEGKKPFPKVWELYEAVNLEYKKGALEGGSPKWIKKNVENLALTIIFGTLTAVGLRGVNYHINAITNAGHFVYYLGIPLMSGCFFAAASQVVIALRFSNDSSTLKKRAATITALATAIWFFTDNVIISASAYSYIGGALASFVLCKSDKFLASNIENIVINETAKKASVVATAYIFAAKEVFTWAWNNSAMKIYHRFKPLGILLEDRWRNLPFR